MPESDSTSSPLTQPAVHSTSETTTAELVATTSIYTTIEASTEIPTTSVNVPIKTKTKKNQRKAAYLCSSLVNYWPVENGTARDFISGKDLVSVRANFTLDRFRNENGALRLKSGKLNKISEYWQAPRGDYFANEYSVTYWFLARSYDKFNSISLILIQLNSFSIPCFFFTK
jgi:hypothetical protein